MAPVEDVSAAALQARFVREAESLGCEVVCCADAAQALASVLRIIGADRAILSWDFAQIPLPGLEDALCGAGIGVLRGDPAVRVGLTGVDAALAGTGSLVLATGPGKPRKPSLMPPVHIAVLTTRQIVPNLDSWAAEQRADTFQRVRASSGVVVISGPSRTGDIANIPVRGVHGPGALHVVILQDT
jgi:L-lactate dehydrogenase complex protein LldG